MKSYFAIFYVAYPYYFPHFLPIYDELKKRNKSVHFILSSEQNSSLMQTIAEENKLDFSFGQERLFEVDVDFIFFANNYNNANELKAKTIFLDHGVGTKHCDYDSALDLFDIVLVEGEYRYNKLKNDFPDRFHKVKKVGFSKLDPIMNLSDDEIDKLYDKYEFDKNKKSILYAPTFFPSSIEKMSDEFPNDFKEFNIIVKPHYLTLSRGRYGAQRKKFNKWKDYPNCQVVGIDEYDLVPFLAICDIMISDESSAIFEFTALNKPVILNRFLKLRLSYYLNPSKILKRMDSGIDSYRKIGDNAESYKDMVRFVYQNLNDVTKYESIRKDFTKDLCGIVDGKASERIVDELH